jgi:hypothetical protein
MSRKDAVFTDTTYTFELRYLYKPYKALGGNGTGESLYKKCLELPLSADRNKKKEE